MRPAVSAIQMSVDVGLGGVLLANMLVAWLDSDSEVSPSEEAVDESQDRRTSPEPTSLHLPTPVDAGPSPPPSGEHRTSVCPARESGGTGLERTPDPHARSGPGQDGHRNGGTGGLQDVSSRGLAGSSGRGIRAGGFATGALESGLASAAGVVCAHRNPGDRRRWLLRSGGLQRWPFARLE